MSLNSGVDPHDLTICRIVSISEAAGELRRLRRPIALASGPHRRHPTPPMPRRRPPPVGEHGRQESIPTRPTIGRRSISTIERRVWFIIVKVGDSLGETFGNFIGRLAATLAILTPVIPAFRASVLVVHPVLPDGGHAAMLTMVKDGNWFRLAHRHLPSMAFYRAMPGADTLKQDELRAAAGQCSERWRRPRVVRWWMRQPWSGFTGVPGIPCLLHGAFAVSSGESGPTQSTWVHRSLPSSNSLDLERAVLWRVAGCGPLPTMAAVSRPLTKAVALVPFGRRKAVHRRR